MNVILNDRQRAVINPETVTSFTFQSWLDACDGDLGDAVFLLNELVGDGEPLILDQPEYSPEEIEDYAVWDGDFQLIKGIPFFVGADGPSGGSCRPGRESQRMRAVTPWDTITLY